MTDCQECKYYRYERDTNAGICSKNVPYDDSGECSQFVSAVPDEDAMYEWERDRRLEEGEKIREE